MRGWEAIPTEIPSSIQYAAPSARVRSHALAATSTTSAAGVSAARTAGETDTAGRRSGRGRGRASGGALMPAAFPVYVAAG